MSDEPLRQLNDPDFEAEMAKIIREAEEAEVADRRAREAEQAKPAASSGTLPPGLVDLLEPIEREVTLSNRRTELIHASLGRLESGVANLAGLASKIAVIDQIRQAMERQQTVDSANQKLFDALHEELKGYKDAFLLESILKPVLIDLISLHDDLLRVAESIQGFVPRLAGTPEGEELGNSATNLEHLVDYLVEILNRREVERLPPSDGLVDKSRHKVIQVEPAGEGVPEGAILRTVRHGFTWREKNIRPEEVVIAKIASQ